MFFFFVYFSNTCVDFCGNTLITNQNTLILFTKISKVWLGYNSGTIQTYTFNSSIMSASQNMTNHTNQVNAVIQINQYQVATASKDLTLRVWDIQTNSLVNTYNAHTNQVNSLVVLPSGYLASGSIDSTVRIWDMQNSVLVSTLNVSSSVYAMILNPIITPNGALVVISANLLTFYDAVTLSLVNPVVMTSRNNYTCMEVLLPSGNVAVGRNFLDIYNTSGSLIFTYNTTSATNVINIMRLLLDNVTLVCGMSNGSLTLFNSNTNAFGYSNSAHTAWVEMLAFTPDLAYLVSGATDKQVIMWTMRTMNLTKVKTFTSLSASIYSGVIIATNLSTDLSIFIKIYNNLIIFNKFLAYLIKVTQFQPCRN
jgi:WD40 repeat protein